MGLVSWYLDWCDRWLPGYSRPEKNTDPSPCKRCGEVIDPTVQACPECGNCPYKDAKWNGIKLMATGFILSLTVIGAIIGIPIFIAGIVSRSSASQLSPTEHDTGATDESAVIANAAGSEE